MQQAAVARPIPEEAPVTMMTLSSRVSLTVVLLLLLSCSGPVNRPLVKVRGG